MVTIELKPNGASISVTEQNKKEYVDAVVDYRISQRVKEQFGAFMEGLLELIPRDLINVFDERELELLIGGTAEIDMYGTFHNHKATYTDIIYFILQGRLDKVHRLSGLWKNWPSHWMVLAVHPFLAIGA